MSAATDSSVRDPQLLRMRAARDQTRATIASINHRLARTAETRARAVPGLPATFGRHASDWTRRHEEQFHRFLGQLTNDARQELGALRTKLQRQEAAIAAHHIRASKRKEPTA